LNPLTHLFDPKNSGGGSGFVGIEIGFACDSERGFYDKLEIETKASLRLNTNSIE